MSAAGAAAPYLDDVTVTVFETPTSPLVSYAFALSSYVLFGGAGTCQLQS
jgi:hypothetical protein